jgi:uncharacterized protein (DUF1697 family)
MPHYAALLRSINVGGRNLVAMSDLRDLFETLMFTGVKTLLQSGNIVFQGRRQTRAALERLLETETKERLAVFVDYLVRTTDEWNAMIAGNPFPKEAESDPSHLAVMFLKEAPKAKDVESLRSAINGSELVRSEGKHLYVVYPAGIARSKLTNALIERKLGSRATGRNWNTVLKLAVLLRE